MIFKEEIMTVIEKLQQIREEICDNYCKYGEKINYAITDKQLEEAMEPCDNCPFNNL